MGKVSLEKRNPFSATLSTYPRASHTKCLNLFFKEEREIKQKRINSKGKDGGIFLDVLILLNDKKCR